MEESGNENLKLGRGGLEKPEYKEYFIEDYVTVILVAIVLINEYKSFCSV